MIEATDASKCDERQVKNKVESLTHKKKGKRQIMSTQGMKTWKLTLFFVVSLMLVAGLFANTASAVLTLGTASAPTLTTVTAEDTVDLTVNYTFGYTLVITGGSTDIVFTLPTNWENPQNNDTSVVEKAPTGDAANSGYIIVKLGAKIITSSTDLDGPLGAANLSASAAHDYNGDTITISFSYDNNAEDRKLVQGILAGKQIVATYYNAKVSNFTRRTSRAADVPNLPATTIDESMTLQQTVKVSDAAGTDDDVEFKINVNRKTLGNVTLSPSTIPAGSKKDLAITYQLTEEMTAGGMIEIQLPVGWDGGQAPELFQIGATLPTKEEVAARTKGYVYLKTLPSKFTGGENGNTTISVISEGGNNDAAPHTIRILFADSLKVLKDRAITLHYKNAVAQRTKSMAGKPEPFKVFSDSDNTATLPEYPATTQPTIAVNAADATAGMVGAKIMGSGIGDGTWLTIIQPDDKGKSVSLFGSDTTALKPNSKNSLPGGSVADDEYGLRLTYTPTGEMTGGSVRLQLPSGWNAATVEPLWTVGLGVGGAMTKTSTGWDFTLGDKFGNEAGDKLEITLNNVTVQKKHGNATLTLKARSTASGSFTSVKTQPKVPVGNTIADIDTVMVDITPKVVYQGQGVEADVNGKSVDKKSVNFEIKLTSSGPMYDSIIRIALPPGLNAPQGSSSAKGYVRKKSASGTVTVTPDGANNRIDIAVDKLDGNKDIKVIYHNVDIPIDYSPLSADASESKFVVSTKTRGATANLADVAFVNIAKDDEGNGGVIGGAILAAAGSGKMAVSPKQVEKGSGNNRFTLTYTAVTELNEATLQITAPDVLATVLTPDPTGTGYVYVSSANKRKLKKDANNKPIEPTITDNSVTWENSLTLGEGEKFVVEIRRVNLSADYTGEFEWYTSVKGTTIVEDPAIDGAETAMITVLGTVKEDVTFEIANYPADGYHAVSEQQIEFMFTATNTALQKGGSVWFTLPGSWTAPAIIDAKKDVPKSRDKGKKARTGIVHAGALVEKTDGDNGLDLDLSGHKITVKVGKNGLAQGGSFTVQYGTTNLPSIVQHNKGDVNIRGYFRAADGLRQRDAGTIKVKIINVADGTGTATISTKPSTVRAGSKDNRVTVVYTGKGTMDGGKVSLGIPSDWGLMQRDPLKLNYVDVIVSSGASFADEDHITIDEDGDDTIIVELKKFDKGNTLTFIYGAGTGSDKNKGAEAQDSISDAVFMVQAAGSADGGLVPIMGEPTPKTLPAVSNVGKVYDEMPGELKIKVRGAESGTGEIKVEILGSAAGDGLYDGETADDKKEKQIHAGDEKKAYIVFTYTPTQTIGDGKLKFTAASGWSAPQEDTTSNPGYTYFEGVDGAIVGNIVFDAAKKSVTADISLTQEQKVKIHYGADGGGATAPKTIQESRFAIAEQGTTESSDRFKNLAVDAVKVRAQRSGGGKVEVKPTDGNSLLYAGDMGRELTITYEAIGQIDDGQLKLNIPENWSKPMGANFEITTTGAGSSVEPMADILFGADEGAVLPEGVTDRDIVIDDVVLKAGQKVMVVYKNVDVQKTIGDATFIVSFDGGDGPDTGVKEVAKKAVSVGQAAPGSGTIAVETDGIILAGSTGNTLTFIYTAAGEVTEELTEFRLRVDSNWSKPDAAAAASDKKGTYEVTHRRDGTEYLEVVGREDPIEYEMIARTVAGAFPLEGDDQVIFEYQNADAPAVAETSIFTMRFNGQTVGPVEVIVQSAEASMLAVNAPPRVSVDPGAAPARVSIMIQDAQGGEAAFGQNLEVMLSSSSSTGSFSLTADGDAMTMVTIPAGMSSAMVYYSDETSGTTATLTASASGSGLTDGTDTIMVTTDVDSVDSVTVSPTVAKAGDTVTVSAMGTPGRTVMFSVGSIVTNKSMTEATSGSYSGSFMVVANQHGDGDYTVTVNLGNESMTASLTIDSTPPTVTASASPATVGNGDTVTITATVDGATSVKADVSALDTTQTTVTLTMANGAYSVDVPISAENDALNGAKTITVTATDAVGNSAMATAMVTLNNKLSYTSTIPAGTSLFHVPLDVDGMDTVGALKTALGDAVSLAIVYDSAAGSWNSRSDNVMITGDLGIILVTSAAITHTFEGQAWGGGASTISLKAGSNLIGLPLDVPNVMNVSDISSLFANGIVASVVVSTDDGFAAASAANDGPVMGDAAYLITATADGTAAVVGKGWSNAATGAAPVALTGYNVDSQTPVLDVQGAVVDEITGLAKEGFRVKVKNLSTKAALSKVTSVEMAEGYNMTFVDLKAAHAARIGDVLEISADSPNPLIGVQPVRHVVTADDVKNSTIQLENLIAYEIPAETALLRNYPNPFNPETWIPYHLAEDADVKLTLYDVNGTVVRTIDMGHQTAAKYDTRTKAVYWDGRNQFGEQVASGIYFYSLSAGDFSATRKMVILK